MSGEGYDLTECLDAIDPSALQYQQWVEIGMALKHEGYGFDVWDSWSRRDAARYKGNGAMERKWRDFGKSSGAPVTGGTIVQTAKDAGWAPLVDMGTALGWNDEVSPLDPSWIEPVHVDDPGADWTGWRDLVRYLETLFDANEIVSCVTDSWLDEKDGRWKPKGKGVHTMTAGDIIAKLHKYCDDEPIDCVLGKPNDEAGAWIRFNPLDGKGVRNDNVTEFRYALVESDDMEIDRQRGIIEELELPVAALVHSGNKSLHAIVRVDAKDYDEFRKRVDYLYRTCQKYGLKLDTQNKNPSRLSRMPGVTRGGNRQFLVATNIGRASWDEWKEWIEELNDDLPDPESLADVWDEIPDLAPPLIDGVLRQGHKMLMAGPSKAGKSIALIELCIAIAEGREWMGFGCAQGRVLYVNLELDRASCLHRFKDVYEAMGCAAGNVANIDIWNLRGKSKPMDQLAPSLIRRALKTRPIAVVIDPIYKVITGDENSADQMAAFCNQFDRVADSLGCAVIYCHHHSKGSQGGKRSMDRSSGSGVFARDPDAILDIIELHLTDAIKEQQEGEAVCARCAAFMDEVAEVAGWRDVVPQDDQVMEKNMLAACKAMLAPVGEGLVTGLLGAVHAARTAAKAKTAWRIEGTLREFPGFDAVNLWFDYPVHRPDETGALGDLAFEGDVLALAAGREAGRAKKSENDGKRQNAKNDLLREAMAACVADGVETTRKNVHERIGEFNGKPVSLESVRRWTDPKKSKWAEITVDPEREKEGVLVDSTMQKMLADW